MNWMRKDGKAALIVFVHVPKSAGSTINAALSKNSPNGKSHVEGIFNTPDFLQLCRKYDWVSGHRTQPQFAEKLAPARRPLRYFACVRNPIKQLISHVNWLSEIRFRGDDFFYGHPKHIQLISFQAGAIDYQNPWPVCGFILQSAQLFLNNQSHYLFGSGHEDLSRQERLERLRRFECIGVDDDLRALSSRLDIEVSGRENAATYRFDPAIFETPELQAFVRRHHALDFELYDMVREMNAAASGVSRLS